MADNTVDFCPAAACAATVVRLEGFVANVSRLLEEARLARSPDLMHELEMVHSDLVLAADAARDRLASVVAVSAAGAAAQLLAAIRDVRVRDDAERERAKKLEARAVQFLDSAGLFDRRFCKPLSGSNLSPKLHAILQDAARQMPGRA